MGVYGAILTPIEITSPLSHFKDRWLAGYSSLKTPPSFTDLFYNLIIANTDIKK